MKKSFVLIIVVVVVILLISGCIDGGTNPNLPTTRDYRQDMRDFIQSISTYVKEINPDFIIIPQAGCELLTENGEEDGTPVAEYLEAIEGVLLEDLFYGYDYEDDVATPDIVREYWISFLDIAESNGTEVLVIDYCSTRSFVDNSSSQNAAKGYISFAADHRELDNIPEYPADPFNPNSDDIISLVEAKNFLYLINPGNFSNKTEFLSTIKETNYDIIFIDLFDEEGIVLTANDVASLKIKDNNGSRLVMAYMCIGDAEEYRYYWQEEWYTNPPSWLAEENPEWPGEYKVRYWDKNWQDIIYGNKNNNSYLKKILDAGFDGVYLDIVDAYEYFESRENGDMDTPGNGNIKFAGVRSSSYGIEPFPEPSGWAISINAMADKFPGSTPAAIWIVGTFGEDENKGDHPYPCLLEFPNPHPGTDYKNISFSSFDKHEEYLDFFDAQGIQVWLQVEPGDANISDLIKLVLDQYGSHPCVKGFGVDLEWYKWDEDYNPEGSAAEADRVEMWLDTMLDYDANYTFFLKHWLEEKMPGLGELSQLHRSKLIFVSDSLDFDSLEAMASEFKQWADNFYPNFVAYQIGYDLDCDDDGDSDKDWWCNYPDPPKKIGETLDSMIEHDFGIFWVDFTLLDVLPTTDGKHNGLLSG